MYNKNINNMSMNDKNAWVCYIIENKGYTYCGASNDEHRRLRCHNGELVGGAKYTTSKGSGWKHVCIIRGFPTKINALQCEWAIKHAPITRKKGESIQARVKQVIYTLNKERWTSKAPLSNTMPLCIEWVQPEYRPLGTISEMFSSQLPNIITEI